MKKNIVITIVILIVAVLVGTCFFLKQDVETPQNPSISTETPTQTEEVLKPTTLSPTEDASIQPTQKTPNEVLTDVWNIVDNEGVAETEILPGLLMDDIEKWMENTEFIEIKLYQRTKWDTVRLGVFNDVAVAEMTMDGDTDLIWNVRMEKSDSHENKTSIIIPEHAQSDEWINDSPEFPVKWYNWDNGDGTWTEMWIVYFADTKNLYTFYSNELVYKYTGDTPTYETITYRNSNRAPDAVLYNIENDDFDMYNYVNQADVQKRKANGDNLIFNFRIKMIGRGTETYQFELGMTLEQWVNSKYNTDGWKFDTKDPYIVISADGRYKLNKDDYCWREMTAELYGPIPTK